MASFRPVVLVGLGSAALAVVAGLRVWTDVEPPGGECSATAPPGFDYASLAQGSPLAGALGLVVLAAWGALLVTRGRVRRGLAALAAVAGVGYLVTAVSAYWSLEDAVRDAAVRQLAGSATDCPLVSVSMNNSWWLLALAAGVVGTATTVVAFRLAPGWPEMSSRYDAPGAAREDDRRDDRVDRVDDPWKALDEGRDPTDPRSP